LSAPGTGEPLQQFEAHVASMLGLEAARFFPTGTLAQQCALKAHASGTEPMLTGALAPTVCLHPTSHLVHLDCLRDGGVQEASFQERARETLPEFTVRAIGDVARSMHCQQRESATVQRLTVTFRLAGCPPSRM
jgi:hypothetical protein